MRLSKKKRNAIDYGGKIMSNFFDETMQGLLEAAEIAKRRKKLYTMKIYDR